VIHLSLDTRQVEQLARAFPTQTKFAVALTLTRLAQNIQRKEQSEIKDRFDTTRTWWLGSQKSGVKIKAARKTDLKSEVKVGDGNTWMERQVTAETKKPSRSGSLIIPAYTRAGKSLNKKSPKWSGIQTDTWLRARGKKAAYDKYSSNYSAALRVKKVKKGKLVNRGRYVVKLSNAKKERKTLNEIKYPFIYDTKAGHTYIVRKRGAKSEIYFWKKTKAKSSKKFPWYEIAKDEFKRTVGIELTRTWIAISQKVNNSRKT